MSVSKPWVALIDCFQDADWCDDRLGLMQQQFVAPSPRVAASMLNSKLMKAVLKPLAQSYLESGAHLPSVALDGLMIDDALTLHWPSQSTVLVSRAQFCQQVHALIEALHGFLVKDFRLAEAIFWSTAALILAMPWQQASQQTAPEQWPDLIQAAREFLAAVDPRLPALIAWLPLSDEALPRLQIIRQHCCLKYSTNQASFCKSCPTGRYKNNLERL